MVHILTFDNFFDKFLPKREGTNFVIQDVQRGLLRNFVHCFQRQFHIRLGYETLSFCFFGTVLSINPICPGGGHRPPHLRKRENINGCGKF